MNKDILPFSHDILDRLVAEFGTPFHLYDEAGIRKNLRELHAAFKNMPGFKEYYAVKACPNPFIMEILKSEKCGMDCSSYGELVLSEATGIIGENIMFTSNNTTKQEFQKAKDLGAIINFDDISLIDFYTENI